MKYTNQIINGDVNVQSLISSRKFLKPATIMMTIQVVIFGFILFGLALLPVAGMDLGRYVHLTYIRQVKLYHRVNYIAGAAASLTSDKNVRKGVCKLLNEML